jgi:hypothetical protein
VTRHQRYNASEKGRARHRRYNASEKGGTRYRRQDRLRMAARIERDDPEFAAYLRGEIAWDDLTPLPPLRAITA